MAMNDEIKMSESESSEAVNNRKRNRDRIVCPPRNRFGNVAVRKQKLYVCCQEVNNRTGCYFIRAVDLDSLMSCCCDFSHETGEETKCDTGVNHEDDFRRVGLLCAEDHHVPNAMSCCLFGSQVVFVGGELATQAVFVGGELAPGLPREKPNTKVYGYDIKDDDELDDLHETNVMSIKELDKASSNIVANIDQHAIYNSRMMEINGDVYALAVNKYELHHSLCNSLVYRTQLQRWEVVPAPMPPPGDHAYFHDTNFSLLVTENRIFLSMQFPVKMPVRCFDTDKNCWIDSVSELPFFGQGLAVDLDTPKEKLVFADGFQSIHVWRLRLTDDLNVSDFKRIGTLKLNSMLLGGFYQRRFINLGDGKVCFVVVKRLYDMHEAARFERVYVIITIFRYEFDPAAEALSYKFLRTRIFGFWPHCIDCEYIRLLNCFVC